MIDQTVDVPRKQKERFASISMPRTFTRACARSAVVVALLIIAIASPAVARSKKKHTGDVEANTPGVFDYYALSLSWAPTYCASHQQDQSECGVGKRYGFVLHGLWPQFLKKWPENCSDATLTPDEETKYASAYPSKKLMEHEWSKHGTCSGLSASEYFDLSDSLRKGLKIPEAYQQPEKSFSSNSDELAQTFRTTNPDIEEGGVLAICSGKFLSEIHVCFSKDGKSHVACSDSEIRSANKSCKDSFIVRNVK